MDPLNYADYLSLNSIIGPDSQKLKSTEAGFEAHDEHLFIVIHQTCVAVCRLRARPHIPPFAHLLSLSLYFAHSPPTRRYELWFLQILWELDSVREIFMAPPVQERSMGIAVGRLVRITEILRILVQQLTVLETMTPIQVCVCQSLFSLSLSLSVCEERAQDVGGSAGSPLRSRSRPVRLPPPPPTH